MTSKYEKVGVPKWFVNKNLSSQEAYVANTSGEWSLRKETEKAVLMRADSDYGHIDIWAPKSVMNQHAAQNSTVPEQKPAKGVSTKSTGAYADKLNSGVDLPDWFKRDNLTKEQWRLLEYAPKKEFTQERETERAVLIKVTGTNTDTNHNETFQTLVPKKVIEKMENLKNNPSKPPSAEVTAKVKIGRAHV